MFGTYFMTLVEICYHSIISDSKRVSLLLLNLERYERHINELYQNILREFKMKIFLNLGFVLSQVEIITRIYERIYKKITDEINPLVMKLDCP